MSRKLSKERSEHVKSRIPKGMNQWSSYPQKSLESPMEADKSMGKAAD